MKKPKKIKMAKNLGKSVVNNTLNVIKGNRLTLPKEESNIRFEICKGCEYFLPEEKRCSDCGCFLVLKTRLRAEKCPQGKW